ncbi:NADH dehydrogenase [ubiquinone] 1 alpha subcomplex subunit 10, mitochondrial [Colletes gigas]|uniref:NADH dehydrogenase [ubiquinone] 1 alpha subcomplex subunit 10, mitochondrial n=1 Tax=Colletes gigas TaxID=935657 RepID=UPI001C9A8A8F|nr:NADH dehydrogenase [ubiquinone] 1 alpha subcomplex subunit 10, mitochondrial [Colletes gigas]XP_043260790.1 NADH dehydrogenase [ubiquinone] 1 alpha subcomplex subunit 10, mitochondrial [Colletes gigas]XP_043260791.1 NADH dehydrogenase [ubiquinone] 1 alpha subcomplex subunit 10, mitochondrial [Colletes gigas]
MVLTFCVGVCRLNTIVSFTRLCKTKTPNATQVAFLTRLARQEPRKKPAPFPYWRKSYNSFQKYFDPIMFRFDDNTQIVVVDGLPAVGKSKFCQKIADEFGLLYMPPPTHDQFYVNVYGFDTRELDPQLPFLTRSFDMPRFLENPHDKRTAHFQMLYLLMRYDQYANALLHMLSTGQGVVLNRCLYSDIVFTEAMKNAGYLTDHVLQHYMKVRDIAMQLVQRPQLIIYLDAPAEIIKEKIKQRGLTYEVNSKVFSTEYLNDLERLYKEKYLAPLESHSHLLFYDWSKETDFTTIIEDIENINFENHADKEKLKDWVFNTDTDVKRLICVNSLGRQKAFGELCMGFVQDCPKELIWTGDDLVQLDEVFDNCVSEKYPPGYNIECGDNKTWTWSHFDLLSVRRTPQDFVNRDKYMS